MRASNCRLAGLLFVLMTMTGCAPAVITPVPSPPRVEPIPAKEELKAGCNRMGGLTTWTCSHEAIAAAVHGLTDAAFDLAEARVALKEAQDLGAIDNAVLAGQLWQSEQDTDRARSQRWVWAAVGIAVGAVATGLVVGLVR